MAYYSGFNPKNINSFTKIRDLNELTKHKNYLIRYSTLGKPRLYHIARFREMKEEEEDKPVYWFDSIYIRRHSEKHWRRQEDERHHIAFDHGELYIDESMINTDYEPDSIYSDNFDFSIFDLGQYGNKITEDVGPEDVISLVTKPKHYMKRHLVTKSATEHRRHGGSRSKTYKNKSRRK